MHPPETTREPVGGGPRARRRPPLAVTLAWHPDIRRVGERFVLPAGRTGIGRTAPVFTGSDGRATAAIADPFVSRRPALVEVDPDGVTITPGGSPLRAGGVVLDSARRWTRSGLGGGLPVRVADRVLLLVHVHDHPGAGGTHGMVGDSAALARLRLDIDRAARLDVPVLLRGESGVGKELVARAVHAASTRAAGPYRAINMAAIHESTAVSALFGHRRGAFTGATEDRRGHFGDVHEGTLFLDEIGDVSPAVQPMLLRALESGEIEPVGGRPRPVDVRVIAATDADLDEGVRDGAFRRPLLHRLAGFVVRVPALRDRVDDIPRLLVHFLRAELAPLGAVERLDGDPTADVPWLGADLVEALLVHRWPGNVRELRNVARRIAAAGFDRDAVPPDVIRDAIPDAIGQGMPDGAAAVDGEAQQSSAASPETLDTPGHRHTPTEIERLLRACGWSVRRAAGRIGVPKSSLLRYAQRVLGLRTAADIPDAEWRACVDELGDDIAAIAERLRVSRRAAGMRVKVLRPD